MKSLFAIVIILLSLSNIFSSEACSDIQNKIKLNQSFNFIPDLSSNHNSDEKSFLKKQNIYYSLSAAMFGFSTATLISSFIFGNFSISEKSESNKLLFGSLSIGLYSHSLLFSIMPAAFLITNLINYFTKYPEKYLNKYYIKIRNTLIISLCLNSTLGLSSFIVSSIYLYKMASEKKKNIEYEYTTANFGYISGICLFGSIAISIAIIIKHCLYKHYNNPKNKVLSKKESFKIYPLFAIKDEDKMIFGLSINIL